MKFDAAVVGAGILGLAHAYHLARQGRRVVVLERHARAQGASVRNFGMLWPIGQPAGPLYHLARRSLEIWLEVLASSGIWHERTGSLHLAYHEDEAQVLREFVEDTRNADYGCELLTPGQLLARCPDINPAGLRAGLGSATETCVDPREVIGSLPAWLERSLGVQFQFDCQVAGYERPRIHTSRGLFEADRLVVCGGDDFQTLYPQAFTGCGLVKCKLQMMRSAPLGQGRRLGPMLAAGLTLRHYKAFAECPTLPELVRRLDRELPEYGRFGIHLLVSQTGRGELTLGDSHEYGEESGPFNKQEIDDLILEYLARFLIAPDLRIASRWHGFYAKHPVESYLVLRPAPGATVVTAVGGAGMTLSFGLGEQVVREIE